jgi:energy-coupling factor transport system permease protein
MADGGRGMVSGVRPRSDVLSTRNPSIKLLAVVVIALVLTFIFDPVTPAVFFLATLLAGKYLGGLRFRDQMRPLIIFLVAGGAVLLGNILFNKGNAAATALMWIGPVKITGPALWAAGTLWLRLMCFALLSLVFVRTTEPQYLILSLIHQVGLNHRVAYGTMVGYRMLPLLRSDYLTIRAAQRVRGVREGRGVMHAWGRLRRYAIPLLAGSVRKAGRVALAMDARAFGAFSDRTYRERMAVRRGDWVFLLLVLVVVAAVVVGFRLLGITRFTVG